MMVELYSSILECFPFIRLFFAEPQIPITYHIWHQISSSNDMFLYALLGVLNIDMLKCHLSTSDNWPSHTHCGL